MVIAEQNEACTSGKSSTRTLNMSNSAHSSSTNGSCSSDVNSDSDSEPSNGVRVGTDYQAEIPDFFRQKPAPENYDEKALLVWTPNNEIEEDKLADYITIACEKYNYNAEQALGVLFWHKFNLECALSDLPNFVPFPDEWSMEDKALFEQAYQFYNKNFIKIHTLLPDKKVSSLVKFYYTWKKTKSKSSYLDRQVKKGSQTKDDSTTDSATNDVMADSDPEYEPNNGVSSHKSQSKECILCKNRTGTHFYNSKMGLLCTKCYNSKRKDGSLKSTANLVVDSNARHTNKVDARKMELISKLSPDLTTMLADIDILNEVAKERQLPIKSKVISSLDNEIEEMTKKYKNLKQVNAAKKAAINESPDYPLLNQNNNRIISRWNDTEILLLTHAVRDFGKDFKTIAEILGNKTDIQIKNYFLQNLDKLTDVLNEFNEENDFEKERTVYEDVEDSRNGNKSK